MNKTELIEQIAKVVFESSSRSAIKQISNPPGRKPPAFLRHLSERYNALDQEARDVVIAAIRIGAWHSVFGFLSILDGVRRFSEDPSDRLELWVRSGAGDVEITDGVGVMLHDLFGEARPLHDVVGGPKKGQY